MANIKISDLTAAAAASGTQEFEVNDSLTSKKVTGSQILAYTKANTTASDIGALANTAGAVGESNLASNSVTTAKIADSNVTTAKIADSAVTLAKMANVATGTVLGRSTAGTGVPEALTTLPAVSGANVTSLNASNLSSGTVGTARLGSGTANSTTFLRGDQTWATAGGAPSGLDAVGSVMWVAINTTSNTLPGNTIAGSSLYYISGFGNASSGQSDTTTSWATSTGFIGRAQKTSTGNTGYVAPTGTTTLSGTWRLLTPAVARSSAFDPCANTTFSSTYCALVVRTA